MSEFIPVPKTHPDRIFCCPMLPIIATSQLILTDTRSPLSIPSFTSAKTSPTQHLAIQNQKSLSFLENRVPTLNWILRNFLVWAAAFDNGECEDGSPFIHPSPRGSSNIEAIGVPVGEKVVRGLHGVRVEMFCGAGVEEKNGEYKVGDEEKKRKEGQEEDEEKKTGEEKEAESCRYFLAVFDTSPLRVAGVPKRITRFLEVPWEVVTVIEHSSAAAGRQDEKSKESESSKQVGQTQQPQQTTLPVQDNSTTSNTNTDTLPKKRRKSRKSKTQTLHERVNTSLKDPIVSDPTHTPLTKEELPSPEHLSASFPCTFHPSHPNLCYKLSYIPELRIDTSILYDERNAGQLAYQVEWGRAHSKFVERVKRMDFGFFWGT